MKQGIFLLVFGLLIAVVGLSIKLFSLTHNFNDAGVLASLFGGGVAIAGVVTMIMGRLS